MVQPLYYFPCIYAFSELLEQPTLTFDLLLQFKRSSYRNRMVIAGSDGPIALSIPLVGGRSIRLPYEEVKIDYTSNWQRDHFRTLCTAYGNSAFFMFYRDELEMLYQQRPSFLYEWNLFCLNWLFKKLKIEKTIVFLNQERLLTETIVEDKYKPQQVGLDTKENEFHYPQVFEDKVGFLPNLSILDLLFNNGPDVRVILFNVKNKLL